MECFDVWSRRMMNNDWWWSKEGLASEWIINFMKSLSHYFKSPPPLNLINVCFYVRPFKFSLINFYCWQRLSCYLTAKFLLFRVWMLVASFANFNASPNKERSKPRQNELVWWIFTTRNNICVEKQIPEKKWGKWNEKLFHARSNLSSINLWRN